MQEWADRNINSYAKVNWQMWKKFKDDDEVYQQFEIK
jgi:hypothetical protein